MIKSLNSILVFVFVILVTNSSFGQELKIFENSQCICSRDSAWHGTCESYSTYEYDINHKGIKLVYKNWIYKNYKGTGNKYILSDSSYLQEKITNLKKVSYLKFKRLVKHININSSDKIIGLDKEYIFSKEFINSQSNDKIQDSLLSIKKAIFSEFTTFPLSACLAFIRVETTYRGEKYILEKYRNNIYWLIRKADTSESAFKFFYPDWNIMINNLMQTPKSEKQFNDLLIIDFNQLRIDLDNNTLIPHKKRKKKHLLENPSVETIDN